MYDISVIVAVYNPDAEKLTYTLNSVLKQRDVSFEVLVCDDGSAEDITPFIEGYFKDKNFTDYKILRLEKNGGTILNILQGCLNAQSDAVKIISPGDYFFDGFSLCEYVKIFKNENAEAVFGRACYYYMDGTLNIVARQNPAALSVYKKGRSGKIFKHLAVYNDYILGAALAYKRDPLVGYLKQMALSGIKFTEDLSTVLFALNGKKFGYTEKYLVWYECDSGISAPESAMNRLVRQDQINFYINCPVDCKRTRLTQKLSRLHSKIKNCKSVLTEKMTAVVYFPCKLFFKLKIKLKKVRTGDIDSADFYAMIN